MAALDGDFEFFFRKNGFPRKFHPDPIIHGKQSFLKFALRESDKLPFQHHFTAGQQMAWRGMQHKVTAIIAHFLFNTLHTVGIQRTVCKNQCKLGRERSHFPRMNIGVSAAAPDMRVTAFSDTDVACGVAVVEGGVNAEAAPLKIEVIITGVAVDVAFSQTVHFESADDFEFQGFLPVTGTDFIVCRFHSDKLESHRKSPAEKSFNPVHAIRIVVYHQRPDGSGLRIELNREKIVLHHDYSLKVVIFFFRHEIESAAGD